MLLPPEEPTGFSAGRALLFLSPFIPILLASGTAFTSSLSPSVSMDGSKLSVQLLSVPSVPCPRSLPSSLQVDATESAPAQRGPVLSGSRAYVAVNFVASLNEQALPASSEG